ncbi:MAG TPA: YciI family protein, partial [Verrucomicrobiae bacterium]|nr:YciI family protein [Verrucomicrobiae bacterium]
MRYMMIVKHREGQGIPPKELMDAIQKLSEEANKAGIMLGNGGLAPMAQGARVRVSGGKVTVTDGPFTEAKEIIGGYAQFELPSKEAAIQSAVEFMELHKSIGPAGKERPRSGRCLSQETLRNIVKPARRSLRRRSKNDVIGSSVCCRSKPFHRR